MKLYEAVNEGLLPSSIVVVLNESEERIQQIYVNAHRNVTFQRTEQGDFEKVPEKCTSEDIFVLSCDGRLYESSGNAEVNVYIMKGFFYETTQRT